MSACRILELPEVVLETVFLELDLEESAICRRVCKTFHRILTENAVLILHFELLAASLAAPLTSRTSKSAAALVKLLASRQARFQKFAPDSSFRVKLESDEGRLYEYLEGYLIRGNGLKPLSQQQMIQRLMLGLNPEALIPHGATIYDLTGGDGEWEDEAETSEDAAARDQEDGPTAYLEEEAEEEMIVRDDGDDVEMYKKKRWESEFAVKDVAMDPGQDLFVVAEMT